MDALRKSVEGDRAKPPKKPVVSEKAPGRKDIGLVKPEKTAQRRKSA
jgi:hypothetical protein